MDPGDSYFLQPFSGVTAALAFSYFLLLTGPFSL